MNKSKKELRSILLKKLKSIPAEQKKAWDKELCTLVIDYLKKQEVRHLHAYFPMPHEIDIKPILEFCWKTNRPLILPKMAPKRQLIQIEVRSMDDLALNSWGIMEARHDEASTLEPKLILCPGLGFNSKGERLGYGGGYYDRFLAKHPQAIKLALAYPFMVLDELPREAHDQKMDLLFKASAEIKN
ncbi:MAG: 5-formyltetrahydrofolate cyclo-ligase [Bacteroidetes bacterium]|nr:5-formyltetrahydrofolate cyclo-ligase [Bacteroidota bacterium]